MSEKLGPKVEVLDYAETKILAASFTDYYLEKQPVHHETEEEKKSIMLDFLKNIESKFIILGSFLNKIHKIAYFEEVKKELRRIYLSEESGYTHAAYSNPYN